MANVDALAQRIYQLRTQEGLALRSNQQGVAQEDTWESDQQAICGNQPPTSVEDLETASPPAESTENINSSETTPEWVSLLQDHYNKSLGELSKSINALESLVRQQGRDVHFVKNYFRGQHLQVQHPIFQLPVMSRKSYCRRCTRSGHTTDNFYRRPHPPDVVCYKCNRGGHVKRHCPQARSTNPHRSNSQIKKPLNYEEASHDGDGLPQSL